MVYGEKNPDPDARDDTSPIEETLLSYKGGGGVPGSEGLRDYLVTSCIPSYQPHSTSTPSCCSASVDGVLLTC